MNIIEFGQKTGLFHQEQFINKHGTLHLGLNQYKYSGIFVLLEELGIDIDDKTCISREQLEKLKQIDIQVDEKNYKWESAARLPYYQIIGKPVTEEQAFDIIRRTDTRINSRIKSESKKQREDEVSLIHLGNLVDDINELSMYGWMHRDGVIAGGWFIFNYIATSEIIHDAYQLLSNFPYLDILMIVTTIEDNHKNIETIKPSIREITSGTEIGVQIRNNQIKILNSADAVELYKKYCKLYKDRDKALYEWSHECDKEYFIKLLEAKGYTINDLRKKGD